MPTIVLSLNDSQGGTSTKELHMDPTQVTTLALAQSSLDAIIATWEGVSDAGVSQAVVSFPLTLTPILAKPSSNLDEAARLSLSMATGIGKENYRLPAPAKTGGVFDFIVGGVVDADNAALNAYFDFFLTAEVFRIGVNSLRAVSDIVSGYLERK